MEDGRAAFSSTIATIKLEWKRNRSHQRSQVSLVLLRVTQYLHAAPIPVRVLAFPTTLVYRLLVEWCFGIEVPWRTQIGAGLRIYHGTGLVLNKDAVLGRNVALRQGVTLGHNAPGSGSPTLEDDVEVGPNAVLLGAITVGAGAVIGAGAVVLEDVPPGALAVGNPAVARTRGSE